MSASAVSDRARIAPDAVRCEAINMVYRAHDQASRRGQRCRRSASRVIQDVRYCASHANIAVGRCDRVGRRRLTAVQVHSLRVWWERLRRSLNVDPEDWPFKRGGSRLFGLPTYAQIGAPYGVSGTAMWRLLNNRSYRNVALDTTEQSPAPSPPDDSAMEEWP